MNYNNVQGKANVNKDKSKRVRGSMADVGLTQYNYTVLHKPYSSEPSEYAYREAARLNLSIDVFMQQYSQPRQLRPKRKKQ